MWCKVFSGFRKPDVRSSPQSINHDYASREVKNRRSYFSECGSKVDHLFWEQGDGGSSPLIPTCNYKSERKEELVTLVILCKHTNNMPRDSSEKRKNFRVGEGERYNLDHTLK